MFRRVRLSLCDITTNAINVRSKEIDSNASRFARKRVRLILRSFVKRSRFTLRSSQSQNELKKLQTKLRRLEKELRRLQ
jgi:hypothetical protein